MEAKHFQDMGGMSVTQGQIRDWLISKVADMVKCPQEDIGVEDSFTSLGLDSLSLFTLTGDLAAWLGYDLSATLLLRHSSIDELAGHLAKSGPGGEMGEPQPRPADGAPLPVTLAQERLLKHANLPPERDGNLVNARFALRGAVNLEAFQQALDGMVARHEILRTTFHQQEGSFVQVVHPPEAAVMDVLDWSAEWTTGSEEEMSLRAHALVMQPVDLGSLPLFRTFVLKVAEDEHRLLFLFHHLLTDGESLRVFYDELSRMYFAHCKGFHPALEPLDWQCADFALWEREWLRKDGAPYQDRLKWWREYWEKPIRWPEFTFTWQTPAVSPPLSACTFAELVEDDTRKRAEALARQSQVTLYTVFLSAFAWHLMNHTSERELVIGTYVSDRKRVAASQLLGMFTSMVPIRVAARGSMTFRELIRQSQEHLDLVSLYRELPFEHLVEHLESSGAPVPGVHTVFQQKEVPHDEFQLDGLQTSMWSAPVPAKLTLGLSFVFIKVEGRLKARTGFNGSLYESEAMHAFFKSFLEHLHKLVHAPDDRLDSHLADKEGDWRNLFGPG